MIKNYYRREILLSNNIDRQSSFSSERINLLLLIINNKSYIYTNIYIYISKLNRLIYQNQHPYRDELS